jgi:hypothetical protein
MLEDKKQLMAMKVANLAEDARQEQCGSPILMFTPVISTIGMKNLKNFVTTWAVCADRLDMLQEQNIRRVRSKGQVLYSTLNGL